VVSRRRGQCRPDTASITNHRVCFCFSYHETSCQLLWRICTSEPRLDERESKLRPWRDTSQNRVKPEAPSAERAVVLVPQPLARHHLAPRPLPFPFSLRASESLFAVAVSAFPRPRAVATRAQNSLVATAFPVSQILNSKPYDPFADVGDSEEATPTTATEVEASKKNKEGSSPARVGPTRRARADAHWLQQRTSSTSVSSRGTAARRSPLSRACRPSMTPRSS
jgi:hypothetical protein